MKQGSSKINITVLRLIVITIIVSKLKVVCFYAFMMGQTLPSFLVASGEGKKRDPGN